MHTHRTFRIDSQTKAHMTESCAQLGMTPSPAFNIFAHAFVRSGGMPFAVKLAPPAKVSRAQMLDDASELLDAFSADYKRMAE